MSSSVSRRSSPRRPPIRATLSSTSSRSARKALSSGSSEASASADAGGASAARRARAQPRLARRARPRRGGGRARGASSRGSLRDELGREVAQALQACVAARRRPAALSSARPRVPSSSISSIDERVGRERVEPDRSAAVQRDEALDPFARLRRDLRRLGRRAEPGDEVELAPTRELDHAREMRPGAARSAGARARARPRTRRGGRRAGAPRRARRAPLRAAGTPPPSRSPDCFSTAARRRCERRAPSKDTSAPVTRRARRGYALAVDSIDWRTAQRIGERIAGSPSQRRRQSVDDRASRV